MDASDTTDTTIQHNEYYYDCLSFMLQQYTYRYVPWQYPMFDETVTR